jgi:hypothetical protein
MDLLMTGRSATMRQRIADVANAIRGIFSSRVEAAIKFSALLSALRATVAVGGGGLEGVTLQNATHQDARLAVEELEREELVGGVVRRLYFPSMPVFLRRGGWRR